MVTPTIMFLLPYIALADAYGAGFEFANFDVQAANLMEGYRAHNLDDTPAGWYTDDTQMSLAVALTVTAHDAPTARDFATAFLDVFKADPRETYARHFFAFLTSCTDVDDFLSRIMPGSERSGAAMRAGPVGLYADIDRVLSVAECQARVTHNTDAGVASAQAVAVAVHHGAHAVHAGCTMPLVDYVNHHVPGYAWETPWSGRVSVDGIPCVRAALTAVRRNNSYASMLVDCVNFTGDTDTVAAIASAIAAVAPDYQLDVPSWMLSDIEQGVFGLPYVQAIDLRLRNWYAAQIKFRDAT